jgi:tetratricopeptide (TPR) repeat protein
VTHNNVCLSQEGKAMRDIDLQKAIRNRNTEAIYNLFIDRNQKKIRNGFYCETDLWDYKTECPSYKSGDALEWAEIAKDVLAFHNNNGGVLIFGVEDKSFVIEGIDLDIDSKLFNDKIRKWLGDKIWVEFSKYYIFDDGRYLGFALIPPKSHWYSLFQANGPEKGKKPLFLQNGTAIRKNDSSCVLTQDEAEKQNASLQIPIVGKFYEIDEENYRILAPDYVSFVYRKDPCSMALEGLSDPRTSVVSLIGIGGIGKTAIATWSVLQAHELNMFPFIISITAKDRELTKSGITSINSTLSSYTTLLDTILEVLGFSESKKENEKDKDELVKSLLSNSKGLLYVDNLETVDDKRIIDFLNNLPVGIKAITTSRRTRVTVSNRPVVIQAMNETECIEYMKSYLLKYPYLKNMKDTEMQVIGVNCNGIPLAMKWIISISKSKEELHTRSEELKMSGFSGNELLEFSFRRIFDDVSTVEKNIIKVLSLFDAPLPIEPIYVSLNNYSPEIFDTLEDLYNDSIVYRYFDTNQNDYSYSLLPLTRNYIRGKLLEPAEETAFRKALSNWYEAKDIKNPLDRTVIQRIRQGSDNPESSLLDLAFSAQKNSKLDEAEDFFRQAIKRNQRSYKALRGYAEFLRHHRRKTGEAISWYEQAIGCMPTRGPDNGVIWREYGILLKDSGLPDATERAIEALESAQIELPNDPYTITTLSSMYIRKAQYLKALPILVPLKNSQQRKTREIVLSQLATIYEYQNEFIKLSEVRRELDSL